jgi:hypothetical protein
MQHFAKDEEESWNLRKRGDRPLIILRNAPSRAQKRFVVIVHRVSFSSAIILCLLFRIVNEHSLDATMSGRAAA